MLPEGPIKTQKMQIIPSISLTFYQKTALKIKKINQLTSNRDFFGQGYTENDNGRKPMSYLLNNFLNISYLPEVNLLST